MVAVWNPIMLAIGLILITLFWRPDVDSHSRMIEEASDFELGAVVSSHAVL